MNQASDKSKSKKIGILCVLAVILLVLLAWAVFGGVPEKMEGPAAESVPGASESVPETVEPTAAETEPVIPVECIDGQIQTPYLTLSYPDALSDNLRIVNSGSSPYTLEFYALLEGKAAQRIFDVAIGEGAAGVVGVFETDAGQLPVGVTVYRFEPDESWNEGEIITIHAMQDGANDLIDQLPLVQEPAQEETPLVADAPEKSNVVNYMKFRTPYCTLQYPAVWKDRVSVEQGEEDVFGIGVYKVRFYGQAESRQKQLLFSVLFGGDEGEQLGTVTNDQNETVSVNIQMEELNLSGWPEEDAAALYAMQEAVNQLIEQLPLD